MAEVENSICKLSGCQCLKSYASRSCRPLRYNLDVLAHRFIHTSSQFLRISVFNRLDYFLSNKEGLNQSSVMSQKRI